MPYFIVTVDIPMPNQGKEPLPLRTSVGIEADHADQARWRVESYAPCRIIDVQEQKVEP